MKNKIQTCAVDAAGCPIWVETPGQPSLPTPPDCPPQHLICGPDGQLACDCPTLTTALCGPSAKGSLREGDFCVTPGTTTFGACRVVDGCYVETKDLACPAGTTCGKTASMQLVAPGAACE